MQLVPALQIGMSGQTPPDSASTVIKKQHKGGDAAAHPEVP